VKLLFENFRKFINEAGDPDSDADDAAELLDMSGGMTRDMIEKTIEKFSFNSGDEESSQHRWGRGQPIIDYSRSWDDGTPRYMATIPSDNWKKVPSEVGEDLVAFLTRVEAGFRQLSLPLAVDPKKDFRNRIARLGSGKPARNPWRDEDLARARGELTGFKKEY